MAIIIPVHAISEPIDEYVIFTRVDRISTLGNHTFEVTLTDQLKDGNNDEIHGRVVYVFNPRDADHDKKRYYVDFVIRPDELPKTFHIDVPFTDTGEMRVAKHYGFSEITHHAFDSRAPKGGSAFNSFYIVGEYGKAADEHGNCKNDELYRVIRPDFSSTVCVYHSTLTKLLERGWYR